MRHFLVATLQLYQRTLSPDHGWFRHRHPVGFCRFYPSCSAYAIEAIERHGIRRGLRFAAWRILRCNPFSEGGIDEVPKTIRSTFSKP